MDYTQNITGPAVGREARDLGYRIGWLIENSQGEEAAAAVHRLIEGLAIAHTEGKPVKVGSGFQRLAAAGVLANLLEKARQHDRTVAYRELGGHSPSPYDTGARLEPFVWVRGEAHEAAPHDRFGRVDFDNEEGATVFTAHAERTEDGSGYVLHVCGDPERVRVEEHGE